VLRNGLDGVAGDIQQRLHQLVRIGGQRGQAGIIVANQLDGFPVLARDEGHDALQHFVHIHVLALRPADGAEQAVGQGSQAIGLTDDDPGELPKFRRGQLPLQELGRATQATQGIPDLVGQLADHAPAGVPLADQRVLPVDLPPLSGI
jgi:hypothetical protein